LSRNGCFVEKNDGLVIGEVEILIDSKKPAVVSFILEN
jgi:hypothetical protein